MAVLNYTTTVDSARTVGEMQQMLAEHGARTVHAEYDAGKAVALAFTIDTPHGIRSFTLPMDPVPVLELLKRTPVKGHRAAPTIEQAERVAWRILKDWLEAQLALIETAMVTLDQVLLPWMHTDEVGTTVYALYQANAMRALPAP